MTLGFTSGVRELDLYRGLSFTTISSTGPNGGMRNFPSFPNYEAQQSTIAIIHYSPDPNDCAIVKKDQVYLCDSGGQRERWFIPHLR